MKIRTHIVFLVAAVLLLCGCTKTASVDRYAIIPQPNNIEVKQETFTLSRHTKICYLGIAQNSETAKYIAQQLRQRHFRPSYTVTPDNDCLTFELLETEDSLLGEEGYRLTISAQGLRVQANTEAALFYGFTTFEQMLPVATHSWRYSKVTMQQCNIVDNPRFAWRGSHIDVARHFFDLKTLKQHIDIMTMYKLNTLHLHLNDDQGWRVEVERYPLLNDIGSWSVDRTNVPWGEGDEPQPNEAATYGGYYTKEEIAELVAYATARHIDIIPEIDLPSHSSAILAAYPNLACTDADTHYYVQAGPCWPPTAVLCAGNDSTITFICNLIDELCQLFPAKYVHIGFDELPKENWGRCERCRKRMNQLNLSNEQQLHQWMLSTIASHVHNQGKVAITWDVTNNSDLAKDDPVMVTSNINDGMRLARQGWKVIMTPMRYSNFDCVQANAQYQPSGIPAELTLKDVYTFNPQPQPLPSRCTGKVLGGEALLWSEYINKPEQLQYMMLPRLCAMAECLWTNSNNKDWELFKQKLTTHKQLFTALKIKYCEGSFRPHVTITEGQNAEYLVTIDCEVNGAELFYAIDGDPTNGHSDIHYTGPFEINEGSTISIRAFFNGKPQEEVYTFEIKK